MQRRGVSPIRTSGTLPSPFSGAANGVAMTASGIPSFAANSLVVGGAIVLILMKRKFADPVSNALNSVSEDGWKRRPEDDFVWII